MSKQAGPIHAVMGTARRFLRSWWLYGHEPHAQVVFVVSLLASLTAGLWAEESPWPSRLSKAALLLLVAWVIVSAVRAAWRPKVRGHLDWMKSRGIPIPGDGELRLDDVLFSGRFVLSLGEFDAGELFGQAYNRYVFETLSRASLGKKTGSLPKLDGKERTRAIETLHSCLLEAAAYGLFDVNQEDAESVALMDRLRNARFTTTPLGAEAIASIRDNRPLGSIARVFSGPSNVG